MPYLDELLERNVNLLELDELVDHVEKLLKVSDNMGVTGPWTLKGSNYHLRKLPLNLRKRIVDLMKPKGIWPKITLNTKLINAYPTGFDPNLFIKNSKAIKDLKAKVQNQDKNGQHWISQGQLYKFPKKKRLEAVVRLARLYDKHKNNLHKITVNQLINDGLNNYQEYLVNIYKSNREEYSHIKPMINEKRNHQKDVAKFEGVDLIGLYLANPKDERIIESLSRLIL